MTSRASTSAGPEPAAAAARLAALILLTFAAALSTAAAAAGSEAAERPSEHALLEPGTPFPDLIFRDAGGKLASMAAFRGRKVILHVFASW